MLIFATMLGMAQAESPSVVSMGTGVVSAETRLITSGTLQQTGGPLSWDPVVQPQVAMAGTLGLTHRLQAHASLPIVASWVANNPAQAPCPGTLSTEAFCEGFLAAGSARVELRYGLLRRPTQLTAGLAATGDPWNASRRGQRNAVGTGRTHVESLVVTGRQFDRRDWTIQGLALVAYGRALSPRVSSLAGSTVLRAPADTLRASVEGEVDPPGAMVFDLGLHWAQRLGGVDLDEHWRAQWLGASLDRWNVLASRSLSVSGRAAVALASGNGIHLRLARTVLAANGPGDQTELGLGWHKVFSPGGPPR